MVLLYLAVNLKYKVIHLNSQCYFAKQVIFPFLVTTKYDQILQVLNH